MWKLLIYFSCLINLVNTSSTTLKSSSKSRPPCLVPSLRGKGFSLSPLSMMLCVCVCVWSHSVVSDSATPWTPGSSLHGILQSRILEWIAISFSKGSSQPRDWTRVSCIAGRRFILWATREAHEYDVAAAAAKSLQSCLTLCEYDVSCGLFICSFYYVKEMSFYPCFVKCFYHKRVLGCVKSCFFINWNDHATFSLILLCVLLIHWSIPICWPILIFYE